MKFFRNPEIKKLLLFYIILSAVFTVVGLYLFRIKGLLVLFCAIIFSVAGLVFTRERYKKLYQLSADIDKVIHGDESIDFKSYSEGELSILNDEVHKMTVRLKEQASSLEKDKKYIADSVADISHQIKTPLTSINLILSFLSDPSLSPDKRAELINELKAITSRIDWLVSSLLKISRLEAGVIEFRKDPVNVKELILKAADSIAVQTDLKNQRVIISLEGSESFMGDFSWSLEAIENILKNCMEHTPENGSIEISGCENTIFTEITIRDSGSGIDEEDLPHLFERFYRGKSTSKNSFGIGLSLARMIINRQNGIINAKNSPEGGALFTIRLYKGAV